MQDGDAAAFFDKVFPHVFGKPVVTVVLTGMFKKQLVVNIQKLPPVLIRNLGKVADDPTDLFEVPVVSQADQAVIGGDVGRKRKLTAAKRAVFAFAMGRAEAGHQVHVFWGFSLHFLFVDRVAGAFVAPQPMPEFGVGFQVCPFLFERDWDGNADIAAKRLAGGVVLPAYFAAILLTDGGGEAGVEIGDVELGFVGHERDFTSKKFILSS